MKGWSLTTFVRNIVRPTVTLSGWTVYLWMVATKMTVPDSFEKAVWGLVAWWFAERSYTAYKALRTGVQPPAGGG